MILDLRFNDLLVAYFTIGAILNSLRNCSPRPPQTTTREKGAHVVRLVIASGS